MLLIQHAMVVHTLDDWFSKMPLNVWRNAQTPVPLKLRRIHRLKAQTLRAPPESRQQRQVDWCIV
ncbi:MAG TPA: hypothetical protein PLR25_30300, partial [Planctomycetaceae bacterium]|nr:hypothetical protein [Planctomycetaceae bacterium]